LLDWTSAIDLVQQHHLNGEGFLTFHPRFASKFRQLDGFIIRPSDVLDNIVYHLYDGFFSISPSVADSMTGNAHITSSDAENSNVFAGLV
jgi:hypothetical protein